ncbi:MAG: acetylglutamate kinase [Gammaproteobacteria bacterium]|nr:acetylglutamate kinase [Gammaproteobacteria bacterium]
MNNSLDNSPAESSQPKIKETIIQLLSNLASPKEINQYMERFVNAGQSHFAVIKVGGGVLEKDLDNLCSSLAFLERIGLFPIVVHGAGPQLNKNLEVKGIKSEFLDGQRVTSAEVLKVAKKTFIQQNLKLANGLQAMGVRTASIPTGVFGATKSSNKTLGFVGEVNEIDLEPIEAAVSSGAIPILSSLAETDTGQILNVNADIATNQLAIAVKPYKIIFLTDTGGLLGENNKIISSVNLATEYDYLLQQEWLHGGMKLKVKQIADILDQLPATASVSITTPMHLSKELFTHKGSGTLIRKGESILTHPQGENIDKQKLTKLFESSFKKTLDDDYFDKTVIQTAYITQCYRAAAIITIENGIPYLDKFVVGEQAKGEGLGKTLWQKISKENESLFWRCKPNNTINGFYFGNSDGCYKMSKWNLYWYGINDFQKVQSCVEYALHKNATLN